jgi:hypothetical protein
MEDKSQTHIRVQKNGVEGWLAKTTWTRIGGNANKDGWVEIQSEPSEVIALREKKAVATSSLEENVTAVSVDPTGEIKQLKKKK